MNALAVIVLFFGACLCADPDLSGCEVAAKTEQGYVCGRMRKASGGVDYASFRGIPYAKQPLGELRFKELQPAESYDGIFNASETGPICPQVDVFYGSLMQPRSMAEDCIRINIHVPYKYFPNATTTTNANRTLLPVFFWIHGGGFSFGSGDPDFHGPEYLVTKDMILVTINYRLHAFGFLSMKNDYFPGNMGIRDVITALKWTQKNIKNFGGDPDKITIGGQSAGGTIVHILSISPAAKGLFKQVIAISGLAIPGGYSLTQKYSDTFNTLFLITMGINPLSSPKTIHDKLVKAPLSKILDANKILLGINGVATFVPVIEEPHANTTMIIPEDPEVTLKQVVGKEYPQMIGFTNKELEIFRKNYIKVGLETKLRVVPFLTLPGNLLYSANPLIIAILTAKHLAKYFDGVLITLDKFIISQIDENYTYVSRRLALQRAAVGAEKTYMYRFAYPGENSPVKVTQGVSFPGAGHVEDITYFFRVNSFMGPPTGADELSNRSDDDKMKNLMTSSIANFVKTGSPAVNEGDWPPTGSDLGYQLLATPEYNFTTADPYFKEGAKEHFDQMYELAFGKTPS